MFSCLWSGRCSIGCTANGGNDADTWKDIINNSMVCFIDESGIGIVYRVADNLGCVLSLSTAMDAYCRSSSAFFLFTIATLHQIHEATGGRGLASPFSSLLFLHCPVTRGFFVSRYLSTAE